MNSEEYKKLISGNDVLDHTTLNVTLKEVVSRQELDIAGEIRRILQENKIPKPELHSKLYDTSTTYYKLDLSADHIEKITDMFYELEASHVDENGEATPTASFYGSLADKWAELG